MIERTLSKKQARAVISLVRERDEIVQHANTQVKEINDAIDEQAEVLRAHYDLPAGKYRFEGDVNGVVLRRVEEKPKEKEPVPPEAKADDVEQIQEDAPPEAVPDDGERIQDEAPLEYDEQDASELP